MSFSEIMGASNTEGVRAILGAAGVEDKVEKTIRELIAQRGEISVYVSKVLSGKWEKKKKREKKKGRTNNCFVSVCVCVCLCVRVCHTTSITTSKNMGGLATKGRRKKKKAIRANEPPF